MSKSNSASRMEDDDVEVDGCQPFSAAERSKGLRGADVSTSSSGIHLDIDAKASDEQRLESGFHSLDFDKLHSEVNEGRLLNSDESLIPVSRELRRLTIDTDDKETRLPSIDEGFYSEEPLDLSKRSAPQPATSIKDEPDRQPEISVDISVYLKHVEETFQQDDDGDT